ncbi:MAG: WG repeat-containing protein [Crocinitomicaceae bacterium]|nr:WG repeat-containing protein [Crocinitomicaceae bacterium]
MKKFTILNQFAIALLLISHSFASAQKLPDLIPLKDKNQYGYCDSNLNVIIKAQYQRAYPFAENRAIVVLNNLYGYIDYKGNQIVPCMYRYAYPFSEGVAIVQTSAGETKYINRNGEFVSNPEENLEQPSEDMWYRKEAVGPIKEGRYFYRGNNDTEGYMTADGDTISSSEYKYPYYSECYSTSDNYDQTFRHFYESRAIVSGKKGQGYIDLNGHLVIDTVFDVAFNFKEGRAKVKLDGKYGFIDQQGQVIGEIKYDQVCYFYDGMAQVIQNGKCGYINLEGEEIIPLIYDFWQGERYSSFHNGLVRVRINEKFGVLDKNGNAITAVKYDDIWSFDNNCAIVLLNDKMGLIDEKGNEVIHPIYDHLYSLDQYAFIFQMNSNKREYGLINIQGKVLIDAVSNRPVEEPTPGLYRIISSSRDYYFIDKYGTKYVKN